MRYYELILSDPKSGDVWKPSATSDVFEKSPGGVTFTSHPNGQINTGALNIEIDLPVVPFNTPQGSGLVRVWGIGLPMIGRAADLNGANITLSAGMKPGLPLATAVAKQAGKILQGLVLQSFGNWQGVNQTLDLICYPQGLTPDLGFCWFWKAGTSLKNAIATVLTQAMPGYKQAITISPNLYLPNDEAGTYENVFQFSSYLTTLTRSIGAKNYGPNYSGVLLTVVGNTVNVNDSTAPQTPIQLATTDFIGQPTWMDVNTVSFKTIMRSDITVMSRVKFPTSSLIAPYVLTAQGAAFPNAPSRVKSIFQGTFQVNEAHHWGNFRQSDADSWVTAFSAVTQLPPTPNLLTATAAL